VYLPQEAKQQKKELRICNSRKDYTKIPTLPQIFYSNQPLPDLSSLHHRSSTATIKKETRGLVVVVISTAVSNDLSATNHLSDSVKADDLGG